MENQERFAWFCTEHAIAHVQSAWLAWMEREYEVRTLHHRLDSAAKRIEHLEQMLHEAKNKRGNLRLVEC